MNDRRLETRPQREHVATLDLATLRRAFAEGRTTPQEEMVLRLRYGVGEPLDAALPSKAMGRDEMRAKLAFFEAELLSADDDPAGPTPNRDRILDALKRLG
jgi:hypothetical protein